MDGHQLSAHSSARHKADARHPSVECTLKGHRVVAAMFLSWLCKDVGHGCRRSLRWSISGPSVVGADLYLGRTAQELSLRSSPPTRPDAA